VCHGIENVLDYVTETDCKHSNLPFWHTSGQKFIISDSLDNKFQHGDAMTGIKYHGQQAFEAEFRTSSKQGGEQWSPAKKSVIGLGATVVL